MTKKTSLNIPYGSGFLRISVPSDRLLGILAAKTVRRRAGKGEKNFMEGLPFPYFGDFGEALKYADTVAGNRSKIYAIPRALSTIARAGR